MYHDSSFYQYSTKSVNFCTNSLRNISIYSESRQVKEKTHLHEIGVCFKMVLMFLENTITPGDNACTIGKVYSHKDYTHSTSKPSHFCLFVFNDFSTYYFIYFFYTLHVTFIWGEG